MTVNQSRLVEEFLELVQVDSAPKDERLMADALLTKLKELGFDAYEDDTGSKIGGNAGNVIGFLEGDPDRPALLFCAHESRITGIWHQARVEKAQSAVMVQQFLRPMT